MRIIGVIETVFGVGECTGSWGLWEKIVILGMRMVEIVEVGEKMVKSKEPLFYYVSRGGGEGVRDMLTFITKWIDN